jgi:hypothetical protein
MLVVVPTQFEDLMRFYVHSLFGATKQLGEKVPIL